MIGGGAPPSPSFPSGFLKHYFMVRLLLSPSPPPFFSLFSALLSKYSVSFLCRLFPPPFPSLKRKNGFFSLPPFSGRSKTLHLSVPLPQHIDFPLFSHKEVYERKLVFPPLPPLSVLFISLCLAAIFFFSGAFSFPF